MNIGTCAASLSIVYLAQHYFSILESEWQRFFSERGIVVLNQCKKAVVELNEAISKGNISLTQMKELVANKDAGFKDLCREMGEKVEEFERWEQKIEDYAKVKSDIDVLWTATKDVLKGNDLTVSKAMTDVWRVARYDINFRKYKKCNTEVRDGNVISEKSRC